MSSQSRASIKQASAAFAHDKGGASALLPEPPNDGSTPPALEPKQRRVIINADDFGMSAEVNEAVIRAYKEGVLTSTSLMVTGAAFEQAVTLAKENPGLAVGIHRAVVGKSILSHSGFGACGRGGTAPTTRQPLEYHSAAGPESSEKTTSLRSFDRPAFRFRTSTAISTFMFTR
jgi:hypothetical protein